MFRAAAFLSVLLYPAVASAHEAYVLTPEEFRDLGDGLQFNVFSVLHNPAEAKFFASAAAFGALLLLAMFLASRTRALRAVSAWLQSHAELGLLFLRLGAGGALLFGAIQGGFLGPEVSFGPFPHLALNMLSGVLGFMLLTGFRTRLAAALGLLLYLFALIPNGAYMFSYFGYIGAFGALMLGGAGTYSADEWRGLRTAGFSFLPPFVRITYGLMLLYGALKIKFLTPNLTLAVVENFGLTGGIFPLNPQLVVLGAGLSELGIALLIILGLELRFALFASLTVATAALLYLPEPAWPHLILYGISLYLLVTPQSFSLSSWIDKKIRT